MLWWMTTIVCAQEITFDPVLDGAITTVALGGYFLLKDLSPRDDTSIALPKAIDNWGHPRWNASAIPVSDFFGHPLTFYGLNAPVLSTVALGVGMGFKTGLPQGLAHSAVVLEAVALNVVVTQGLKLWISRPRPFTSRAFQEQFPEAYRGEYLQEEISGKDAWLSMPSGHTSTAAATYTSIATLLSFHDPKNRNWYYGGAATLIVLAGSTRVMAGMHHPTDVLAGALLGASIGYAVATFHTVANASSPTAPTPNVFSFQGQW